MVLIAILTVHVLATRTVAGSIFGETRFPVPAEARFFNKMRAAFVTEQESSSPTSATWNLLRDPEHTSIPVKIDISLNLMPRETEQDPLLPSSTSSDSASTESAQSAKGFKYVPTLDMVPTTRDKLSLSLIFVSRIFGR